MRKKLGKGHPPLTLLVAVHVQQLQILTSATEHVLIPVPHPGPIPVLVAHILIVVRVPDLPFPIAVVTGLRSTGVTTRGRKHEGRNQEREVKKEKEKALTTPPSERGREILAQSSRRERVNQNILRADTVCRHLTGRSVEITTPLPQ